MRTFIILLSCFCVVLAHLEGLIPFQKRFKRDAVGALDIVTNNAQPIHADVKVENMASENGGSTSATEKLPAEDGTTVSTGDNSTVTPPKDVMTFKEKNYALKSARKSWPLTSRLDMIRSVSRIVTLIVMVISGVLEFYPLLQHLLNLYY